VVEAAADKQADNIVILDMRQICSFADYFVICSGESVRQLEAIYQEIREALRREGVLPYRSEGTAESGWVLVDFGEVVAHLLSTGQRNYYRLDELWEKAAPVVKLQ